MSLNNNVFFIFAFTMFLSSAWADDQSGFGQNSPYQQYMQNENNQYQQAQQQPIRMSTPGIGQSRGYGQNQGLNPGINQGQNQGLNPGINQGLYPNQMYNQQNQPYSQNSFQNQPSKQDQVAIQNEQIRQWMSTQPPAIKNMLSGAQGQQQ